MSHWPYLHRSRQFNFLSNTNVSDNNNNQIAFLLPVFFLQHENFYSIELLLHTHTECIKRQFFLLLLLLLLLITHAKRFHLAKPYGMLSFALLWLINAILFVVRNWKATELPEQILMGYLNAKQLCWLRKSIAGLLFVLLFFHSLFA